MNSNRKRFAETLDESYLDGEDFEVPLNLDTGNEDAKRLRVNDSRAEEAQDGFISNASNVSSENDGNVVPNAKQDDEFNFEIIDLPTNMPQEEEEFDALLDFPETEDSQFKSDFLAAMPKPDRVSTEQSQSKPKADALFVGPNQTYQPNFFPLANDNSVRLRNGEKIDYTIDENERHCKTVKLSGLNNLTKLSIALFLSTRIQNYGIKGVVCAFENRNTVRLEIDPTSNCRTKADIENLISDLCQGKIYAQGYIPGVYQTNLDCVKLGQVKISEQNGEKKIEFMFKDKDFAKKITKAIRNKFDVIPKNAFQIETQKRVFCAITIGKASLVKDDNALLDMLQILLNPDVTRGEVKIIKDLLIRESKPDPAPRHV